MLKADRTILILPDGAAGHEPLTTTCHYRKPGTTQTLWERRANHSAPEAWRPVDLVERVADPDAEFEGSFCVTLRPGERYDAALLPEGAEPGAARTAVETITIHALGRPAPRALIEHLTWDVGGTSAALSLLTFGAVEIILLGLSNNPIETEASTGLPFLNAPVGPVVRGIAVGADGNIELELGRLMSGRVHHGLVIVADASGNWQARTWEMRALRRMLAVTFAGVRIFNHDPEGYLEADIVLEVVENGRKRASFALPTLKINRSDPTALHALGYTFAEPPRTVFEPDTEILLRAWGVEDADDLDADEQAIGEVRLDLPSGLARESVNMDRTRIVCRGTYADDFGFDVDVRWSVTYVP